MCGELCTHGVNPLSTPTPTHIHIYNPFIHTQITTTGRLIETEPKVLKVMNTNIHAGPDMAPFCQHIVATGMAVLAIQSTVRDKDKAIAERRLVAVCPQVKCRPLSFSNDPSSEDTAHFRI